MAENDAPVPAPQEPTPAEETVEHTAVQEAAAPAAEPKQKLTDRLFNFRAMVAVALAALLLGGGAGAAIAAITHDDEPDRRPGFVRFGDGPGGPGGFGPGDRQQMRRDFGEMRQDFRDRMREYRQDEQEAPPAPPSPSTTPNG